MLLYTSVHYNPKQQQQQQPQRGVKDGNNNGFRGTHSTEALPRTPAKDDFRWHSRATEFNVFGLIIAQRTRPCLET